ncbi:hypothetical protein AVEN_244441-1 [Araneus ventricosus]|uniref:Uncharacterized protein n=1 Tax=Araneus ventricosus TaxID=182803 RepID=A0A4Y2NX40_ARAVE|nr:hypothetical protein AVEN_244441-1 [Araneus ventricosus]
MLDLSLWQLEKHLISKRFHFFGGARLPRQSGQCVLFTYSSSKKPINDARLNQTPQATEEQNFCTDKGQTYSNFSLSQKGPKNVPQNPEIYIPYQDLPPPHLAIVCYSS